MVELVADIITGLFELIASLIVETGNDSAKKQGYSENKTSKLERNITWSLVAAFIIFLFWLTLKYS